MKTLSLWCSTIPVPEMQGPQFYHRGKQIPSLRAISTTQKPSSVPFTQQVNTLDSSQQNTSYFINMACPEGKQS